MLLPPKELPSGKNTTNQFVAIKGGATDFIKFVEGTLDVKERIKVRTPDKDGTLIHAEIEMGNATLMLCDSKEDWPFTPGLIQVYVQDAQEVLERATSRGAELVTEVSEFYGGFKLARFKDPWRNIWWLYEPDPEGEQKSDHSSTADWHDKKPSLVYTTIMDGMRHIERETNGTAS